MVNGIHSNIFIFLYLELLIYLACIFQMDLPEMLSQYNSFDTIIEKDYDISLRVNAIQIRQLLYKFYWALALSESEPDENAVTADTETESKADSSPYELLCKIVACCNRTIYEIRKKSNVDRYIEVKSYSKNLGFYWSKNEVNTARKKGENYCLYLVNRDKMEENNYVPTIITNAFFEVFQNKSWHKEAETYFVKHSK